MPIEGFINNYYIIINIYSIAFRVNKRRYSLNKSIQGISFFEKPLYDIFNKTLYLHLKRFLTFI